MPRDYYEVLDVARDAGEKEIKKAYKKAARKFHPDLNRDDPSAEVKFKEASEAYDVLSTPQKRQIYDQYGHDGLRGRGIDPNFTDLGDIFSAFGDMFGGGFADLFGRGGGRSRGPARGADLEYPLRLDFMEAALGSEHTVSIPVREHCGACEGQGVKPGKSKTSCGTCGGAGQVIQAQGFLRIRTTCPSCRGAGQTVAPGDHCGKCTGSGHQRTTKEVQIRVPAGSYTGLQIRHPGKGEVGEPGASPGDLYVTLDVAPHSLFKRDGKDVYVTIPIPYPLMCLGGHITIPTIHGEEPLDVPPGTESGGTFTFRGKGIADLRVRGQRGDHLVRLQVEVPKQLLEEEEELLRRLAELRKVGVQEKGFWQGLFEKLTS